MSNMVCLKSGPKKQQCVSNGSFNTVRTPMFQVVQIFLNPVELKSQIGDP